ncbi:MAG TPA: hypothetical protein VGU20_21505 [Stellaceae bacterium]|nr:hypothetical protein [Stellaceae bacterium]
MRLQRKMLWTGATAVALVAMIGTALAGYTTGDTFMKASNSYKLGYAAGAIDMLTALQEQKLIKDGAFNDQTAKIAQCLRDKKVKQSQIANAYLTYLKENQKRQAEAAAPDISNAMAIACQIK